jgi:hypothetical protein
MFERGNNRCGTAAKMKVVVGTEEKFHENRKEIWPWRDVLGSRDGSLLAGRAIPSEGAKGRQCNLVDRPN